MDRANQMASMYESGKTYEEIGSCFGISRERVRQILSKLGMTGESGGVHIRTAMKRANILKARDAVSLKTYGFPSTEMLFFMRTGMYRKFLRQRESAKFRGIEWQFTFPQWVKVWEESGYWTSRGKKANQYCMARKGDTGPYAVDNVYFCTIAENTSVANKGKKRR